jgi:hypothetical protein
MSLIMYAVHNDTRMKLRDCLRQAWDCRECRTYRRAALALGLLAACSWLLL